MDDHELFIVVAIVWITFAAVVYAFIRFLNLWHNFLDYLHRYR